MNRFLILAIVIICASCSDNSKQKKSSERDDLSKELYIEKTVSFPISSSEYYQSSQTTVFDANNTTLLYRQNNYTNSLDVYDFSSQKKEITISYKKEGPNGIRKFSGSAILPLSKDSIFIATLTGKIYIMKGDSVLYSNRPTLREDYFRFFGKSNFLPKRIDDNIFMYTASSYTMKDNGFFTRPLIVSYNLKTEKVKICNVSYPDFAKNECWSEHHFEVPFTVNNKDQIIVSFPFTEEIFIYDTVKDSVIQKIMTAKSNYVDRVAPYKACDFTNPEKYFSYLKSVPRYYSLIYDTYRDVYYRVVLLPSDELDGKRNEDIVMPISIMLLDNNFNVLAEKKLKKRNYNYKDFFVDNDGFWLSNNNTANETFDEDKLSFSLFKSRIKE